MVNQMKLPATLYEDDTPREGMRQTRERFDALRFRLMQVRAGKWPTDG